ncbi:MAG: sigma-54 factor, interaction protein [Firmicutes bacterium]|nr:sigma-54 factor, interaction protein [Bacillota bacterium]
MKRIDKIYNYIKSTSKQYNIEQLRGRIGVDAGEISDHLKILKNNVSMELNVLFKMDKVIKIKGRPVLYLDKQALETLCGKALGKGPIEVGCLEEVVDVSGKSSEKDPFKQLIGAKGSLQKHIEQAKAAVLYPPNGLHTLIVGQTGVGKTLFANMMYSYGKSVKRLSEASPFIIFNCADYYNNSQLLMAHLFGHVKGAFTGADTEKKGVVESADGGVLFLDEIHRLPPEGQEMIFYFIDTGTFNKLGETERKRKANVLIIGATTEDQTSSLIKTFVRRIPNVITIPALTERSLQERVDIIKFLLSNEVHRVNKPVKISSEAIKALVGSISYGNIGQLKSNIQLVCAKAFLNGINNEKYIEIDFKTLPDNVKNGLLILAGNRKEAEALTQYIDDKIVIIPQGQKALVEDDPYELPFNLYKTIEDKATLLKDEGIDDELIKKFISADMNLHIKSFYNKFNTLMSERQKILKIVDKSLLEFAEEIQQLASKRLNKEYNERFLYAFSLHLSALFKRLKSNQTLQYAELESVITDYPNEFKAALEIKAKIEERYNIDIPSGELEYFTILLSSVQETEQDGNVAIIVVAHGNSTASSMVEVTQKLLNCGCNIAAIDMSLEVSPRDVLETLIVKVQEMESGKGVLLLVDMGSLVNLGAMIMEKVDIKVKTVDMVSTPLVLEAARRASLLGTDLEGIYNSLTKFKGYADALEKDQLYNYDNGVIVTICTSGKGTAVKLKKLVEDIVNNLIDEHIEVLPVGVYKLKESIEEIQQHHKIIASVGVVNPEIDAPFIPLEALIGSQGEEILKDIVSNNFTVVEKKRDIVVKSICQDILNQFLTYLNPTKVVSVLIEFQSVLEKELNQEFSRSTKIKLIVHVGCALERMVIKDGMEYSGDRASVSAKAVNSIKKAAAVFKNTIQIDLTEDEMMYIAEML